MADRCRHCDERYSEVDPVHVCSKGPFAPKLMLPPATLQERPYREHAAHIAGLKEALEMAREKRASQTGAPSVAIFIVMQAIESRINDLEGK